MDAGSAAPSHQGVTPGTVAVIPLVAALQPLAEFQASLFRTAWWHPQTPAGRRRCRWVHGCASLLACTVEQREEG